MEDLAKQLENIGLEDKEAEIYLAILQLGLSNVVDIARKAEIKRTTVYEYLDNLLRRGLICKTVKGKRIFYLAEKPERILHIWEVKKKHLEKILPELQSFYALSSGKPKVKFYEGVEGMRQIYREMTKTSKTLWSVFSADKYYNAFSEKDGLEFFENIKEHGGQIKDLVEDTPAGREYVKSGYHKGIGGAKLLPKDFKLAADILVTGNKVAMNSLVNMVGVIIENSEIAEVQRNFIKFLWKNTN